MILVTVTHLKCVCGQLIAAGMTGSAIVHDLLRVEWGGGKDGIIRYAAMCAL